RRGVVLLLADGGGGDDADRRPLGRAAERQRGPGAAAGVLNDGAAGPETSVLLGALDRRERHPVLHRRGRVVSLHLYQHAGVTGRDDMTELHERRSADGLEDGGCAAHTQRLTRRGSSPKIRPASGRLPCRMTSVSS